MDMDSMTTQALSRLIEAGAAESAANEALYVHLRDSGLLSKVTLHRYQCDKGCQIATVYRAGGKTMCWVRDYKFSRGLNAQVSVEAARQKNTIDGERHWPGRVHDVEALDRFSTFESRAGMDMNCRHRRQTIFAADLLKTVENVIPGKPGKPTRLAG